MGPRSGVLQRLPAGCWGVAPHCRCDQVWVWSWGTARGIQATPDVLIQVSLWAGGRGRMDTEGRPWGDREGRGAESPPPKLEEARKGSTRSIESRWSSGRGGIWGSRRWRPGWEGERRQGWQDKASHGRPALARWELKGLEGRAVRAAESSRKTCPRTPRVACRLLAVAPSVPQHQEPRPTLGCTPRPCCAPLPPWRQEGRRPAGHVASRIHIAFPGFCSSLQGVQGS